MSPAKKKPSSPRKVTRASQTKAKKPAAKTVRKTSRKATGRTTSAPSKAASVVPARTQARIVEINETVKMVRDLAAVVDRRSLTELIVETKDATYTLRREAAQSVQQLTGMPVFAPPVAPPPPAVEAAAPVAKDEAADDGHHVVTSPFVGTFYRRPNPDADTYCEVGQHVEKGHAMCIVEAMKLMNEIEADAAGIVVAVLVDDAEPVEYGQPLFKIDPS